jgi:hypothetical protein
LTFNTEDGIIIFVERIVVYPQMMHLRSWEVPFLRIRTFEMGPIMTLVKAAKTRRNFDAKTFLSTIDGGTTITTFPKKQTIVPQGDSSDAVFIYTKKKGKTNRCVEDWEGSHDRHSERGRLLRAWVPHRAKSPVVLCNHDGRLLP